MRDQWPWLLVMLSVTLGLLGFLCIMLLLNLCTFPRLRRWSTRAVQKTAQEQVPLVSVLIPARNEAQAIERCVNALLAQSYPRLEVLVLDDQSSDGTDAIVARLIAALSEQQQGRLRLLRGTPLPAGWVGKNYACYQLAQAARGDYLYFTDADTEHAPQIVQATIACMQNYNVKLLTALPEFRTVSLGERMILPLVNFLTLTLLPAILVRTRREASIAIGNGQLLCFEREAYAAIAGHAGVKTLILEDVHLARKIKSAGYRMIFVDALGLLSCRMYTSWHEVWQGFSKNLFALYNYSLPMASVGLLMNILLYIVPPLTLSAALFVPLAPSIILLAAGSCLLTILMRVLLILRYTSRPWGLKLLLCLLHPISIIMESLILLNAVRWRYRKQGTVWKGRYYVS